MELRIIVFVYFIFQLLIFSGLIIYSKYAKVSKNSFVGFRTKYSMINDETFKYGNELFNTYNIYICLYLLLFNVVCLVISYLFSHIFYIIYLPILVLLIAYILIIFRINNMIKRKFNL